MKPKQVTPKRPTPQEKRPYIRPELKKFGELKNMTAGISPEGLVSGTLK